MHKEIASSILDTFDIRLQLVDIAHNACTLLCRYLSIQYVCPSVITVICRLCLVY